MSLAMRTASASSSNGMTAATGPKISSRAIRIVVVDVGEDGRGQVEAVAEPVGVRALAAGDQLGALLLAEGDVAGDRSALAGEISGPISVASSSGSPTRRPRWPGEAATKSS